MKQLQLAVWSGAVAAALILGGHATGTAPTEVPEPELVDCTGGVNHPLSGRVTPQGDIVRGGVFQAVVEVSAGQEMDNVRVRLVNPGGAEPAGPVTAALGPLAAGERGSASFAVRVPVKGQRFLLEFQIEGEGPTGLMTRGAAYNILPDGPADPGEVVQTPDGRSLRTYAASARRIDQ